MANPAAAAGAANERAVGLGIGWPEIAARLVVSRQAARQQRRHGVRAHLDRSSGRSRSPERHVKITRYVANSCRAPGPQPNQLPSPDRDRRPGFWQLAVCPLFLIGSRPFSMAR
jgi:hypothetical protein